MSPEPLIHVVREADGEPDGALILLHGRGADEHDLAPLIDVLDPERRLVGLTPGAPIQPDPTRGGGRWWYMVPRVGHPDPSTFHATYEQLTAFLDAWLVEREVPWQRTILGGFSMGCAMSYATGLGPRRPSPAGIVAMSGFIPTVEGWQAELDARGGLPVFIAHGSRDPVISVEFARDARATLEDAGLDVTYQEHDGGHHLDHATLPRMADWVARRVASFSA